MLFRSLFILDYGKGVSDKGKYLIYSVVALSFAGILFRQNAALSGGWMLFIVLGVSLPMVLMRDESDVTTPAP